MLIHSECSYRLDRPLRDTSVSNHPSGTLKKGTVRPNYCFKDYSNKKGPSEGFPLTGKFFFRFRSVINKYLIRRFFNGIQYILGLRHAFFRSWRLREDVFIKHFEKKNNANNSFRILLNLQFQ